MQETKRRASIGAIMVMVAMLSILLAPDVTSAGTWYRVVGVPHRGTWFASSRVYGQSWHRYYHGQAEDGPLCMQVTTRLFVVNKYGSVHRSNSVVKTVYNSDCVAAQASYVHRAYVSDAYSYATFLIQHADGSWSWDSYYGTHSGPLG